MELDTLEAELRMCVCFLQMPWSSFHIRTFILTSWLEDYWIWIKFPGWIKGLRLHVLLPRAQWKHTNHNLISLCMWTDFFFLVCPFPGYLALEDHGLRLEFLSMGPSSSAQALIPTPKPKLLDYWQPLSGQPIPQHTLTPVFSFCFSP